jgi:FkbM family methyltransferase
MHRIYQKVSIAYDKIVETKYNFKMKLTTWLLIDDTIIYKWIREPGISKVIADNLKKWDIFLDIWANIWYYSLLASRIVGWEGKVIAFEPNTINYNKFLENIKINKYKNIDVKKMWVWNINTKLELFYDEKNPGATSLVKGKNHSEKNKEIIEIVKLDKLFWNIKIDVIKMDIEWFEYEAILWMINILKNNKKIKMIFELSPYIYKRKEKDYIGYSIDILNTLSKLWFEMWNIWSNGKLEKIRDNAKYVEKTTNNKHGQSDIYCVKNK